MQKCITEFSKKNISRVISACPALVIYSFIPKEKDKEKLPKI